MDNGRKTASIFKVTRIKGIPQVLLRQGNNKGIELFHQPDEIIGHYGPKAKCHVRIKTFAPLSPFVEVKLSLKSVEKQFYSKMQSSQCFSNIKHRPIPYYIIKFMQNSKHQQCRCWCFMNCHMHIDFFLSWKKKSPSLCIRCFNN